MSASPSTNTVPATPVPANLLDRAWKVDAAGLLLAGVLTLGGYWAGLGPYLGAKVEKARHDMAMDDARRARDEARTENERFTKLLATKREKTASVEIILEPFEQRHLRVGAVAQLAADSNVKLDQITPKDPEAIGGVSAVVRVPIVLTGKGSYAQIQAFLQGMHAQFKDTAVESVHMLAEPGSNGGTSSFSVSLVWYARPDIPS